MFKDHDFEEFQKNLTDRNPNKAFKKFISDCPAKKLLGHIFSRLNSIEKLEELKAVGELVPSAKPYCVENSTITLARGDCHKKLAWGYYFYLHLNKPKIAGLEPVDNEVLGGTRLYPSLFLQYVDGTPYKEPSYDKEESGTPAGSIQAEKAVW